MIEIKKSILHINSYFFSNDLHYELITNLKKYLQYQTVFIPLKKNEKVKKISRCNGIKIIKCHCYSNLSRIFWPLKTFLIYKSLFRNIKINEIKEVSIVHSHSVVSNGIIAFILNRKFNLPYIVTVRNTDISIFIKRSKLFRFIASKILLNSSAIIVLAPAFEKVQLANNLKPLIYNKLKNKINLVQNGINQFWIDNLRIPIGFSYERERVNILFVGKLRPNKNILGLIDACSLLFKKGFPIKLNIAGDGFLLEKLKKIKTEYELEFYGHVKNKNDLMAIYRGSHLLAVPSFLESFGLVYAEALSQGLPIIYSQGQGFDGFFPDGEVGYRVNPNDSNDIANKIELILDNYSRIITNISNKSNIFSWEDNSKKLYNIYSKISKTL